MSEKEKNVKRSPARPSVKVSIPIDIFLKRKEKMRQAALLEKQRLMLDKMKDDHKRSEITPEKDDTSEKGPNAGDGEAIEGKTEPAVSRPAPEPVCLGRLVPCGSCQPPRPLRPKRSHRLQPYAPRPQRPQRPQVYCDTNNNILLPHVQLQRFRGNRLLPPTEDDIVRKNPMFRPRFI